MSSAVKTKALAEKLKKDFHYSFKDAERLNLACVHKSYGNEKHPELNIAQRDNERLEFLGDAVLDMIVSLLLAEEFTNAAEGDLSRMRAGLVNEKTLARLARELDLGAALLLGKGEEQTGGREKDSILSSAFEALIAGIFLDGGYGPTEKFVRQMFDSRLRDQESADRLHDYKTRLQEVFQAKFRFAPRYEVVSTEGPDHDKTFTVKLVAKGRAICEAVGKNKKEAEQKAARMILEKYIDADDLKGLEALLEEA